MCQVLKVSKSAYYKSCKAENTILSRRSKLEALILEIWTKSNKTYGSPRVHTELVNMQIQVSLTTVERTMKRLNIQSIKHKKFKVCTTDSNHSEKVSLNLLNREFTALKPATKWVSDITYIHTKEGWLYLTTVMDLFDRKVIGWAMSNTMLTEETTIPAFKMAVKKRRPKRGELLFHSDRGVQYAAKSFRKELRRFRTIQSMSRKGNCWDNAVAESFFSTLKWERVNTKVYTTISQAKLDVFEYIEGWYNRNRISYFLKNNLNNKNWINFTNIA